MSTTFSANFGSFDSLNGRVRCGLRPCSFQTRCTVVWPTPISSANMRALQCVACLGFSWADACLYVRPSDRTTLERLVADGKTPQKIVARARIVLLSGCGFGTNSIQREARVSKPTVWRWQKAYMDGGVERLLKDTAHMCLSDHYMN